MSIALMKESLMCWNLAVLQLLEAAEVEKRRRFTAAAFHHISAMKIQRALRAQWALQSAKKEIHSVIAIQVQKDTSALSLFPLVIMTRPWN